MSIPKSSNVQPVDQATLSPNAKKNGEVQHAPANSQGDRVFTPDHQPQSSDGAFDFVPPIAAAGGLTTPMGPDPYDPAVLGMSQDFVGEAQVKKHWDIIRVEKPNKARVFRVHADPAFRLKTLLLVLKEDSESYLVLPHLREHLANEGTCGVFALLPCVSKQGTPFIWPIRMADSEGKWNIWHQSAWQIAERAMVRWARMQSNRDAGHYVAEYDQRHLEQQQLPAWPDLTLADWLRLAFRGYTIDSLDHPILRRLRLQD